MGTLGTGSWMEPSLKIFEGCSSSSSSSSFHDQYGHQDHFICLGWSSTPNIINISVSGEVRPSSRNSPYAWRVSTSWLIFHHYSQIWNAKRLTKPSYSNRSATELQKLQKSQILEPWLDMKSYIYIFWKLWLLIGPHLGSWSIKWRIRIKTFGFLCSIWIHLGLSYFLQRISEPFQFLFRRAGIISSPRVGRRRCLEHTKIVDTTYFIGMFWRNTGIYSDMEVSEIRGTPNGWFIVENPTKMDDLGVPLFKETSIYSDIPWGKHTERNGQPMLLRKIVDFPRLCWFTGGSFWQLATCLFFVLLSPRIWVTIHNQTRKQRQLWKKWTI